MTKKASDPKAVSLKEQFWSFKEKAEEFRALAMGNYLQVYSKDVKKTHPHLISVAMLAGTLEAIGATMVAAQYAAGQKADVAKICDDLLEYTKGALEDVKIHLNIISPLINDKIE